MSVRYFRASVAMYQSICRQIDAAYEYPNAATKTERALPAADTLPTDSSGRVYLEVLSDYCQYNLPSELLRQFLASGAVEEISEAIYTASLPKPTP